MNLFGVIFLLLVVAVEVSNGFVPFDMMGIGGIVPWMTSSYSQAPQRGIVITAEKEDDGANPGHAVSSGHSDHSKMDDKYGGRHVHYIGKPEYAGGRNGEHDPHSAHHGSEKQAFFAPKPNDFAQHKDAHSRGRFGQRHRKHRHHANSYGVHRIPFNHGSSNYGHNADKHNFYFDGNTPSRHGHHGYDEYGSHPNHGGNYGFSHSNKPYRFIFDEYDHENFGEGGYGTDRGHNYHDNKHSSYASGTHGFDNENYEPYPTYERSESSKLLNRRHPYDYYAADRHGSDDPYGYEGMSYESEPVAFDYGDDQGSYGSGHLSDPNVISYDYPGDTYDAWYDPYESGVDSKWTGMDNEWNAYGPSYGQSDYPEYDVHGYSYPVSDDYSY